MGASGPFPVHMAVCRWTGKVCMYVGICVGVMGTSHMLEAQCGCGWGQSRGKMTPSASPIPKLLVPLLQPPGLDIPQGSRPSPCDWHLCPGQPSAESP